MIVNFFNLVMETKNIEMIKKFHRHVGMLVKDLVQNNPEKYDN